MGYILLIFRLEKPSRDHISNNLMLNILGLLPNSEGRTLNLKSDWFSGGLSSTVLDRRNGIIRRQ